MKDYNPKQVHSQLNAEHQAIKDFRIAEYQRKYGIILPQIKRPSERLYPTFHGSQFVHKILNTLCELVRRK